MKHNFWDAKLLSWKIYVVVMLLDCFVFKIVNYFLPPSRVRCQTVSFCLDFKLVTVDNTGNSLLPFRRLERD